MAKIGLGMAVSVGAPLVTRFIVGANVSNIDGRVHPFDAIKPGAVIELESGSRGALAIRNVAGTAANPITIINASDGQTVIDTTEGWYGIWFQNCQHFRLTGTGKVGTTYGIKIAQAPNNGIIFQNKTHEFEMDHIEVLRVDGGIGIQGQTVTTAAGDYDYNNDGVEDDLDIVTRATFTQRNLYFHHIHVDGTVGQNYNDMAFYVGNSNYHDELNPVVEGLEVHDFLAENLNNKVFQVGSVTSGLDLHDITLQTGCTDAAATNPIGFSINPGCTGSIYNVRAYDINGFGISLRGLGNIKLYNSVFARCGKAGTSFDAGINAALPGGYSGNNTLTLVNNTVVDAVGNSIEIGAGFDGAKLVQNNISASPGDQHYSLVAGTTNDHNLSATNVSDAWFTDADNDDFSIGEHSTAIDTGADVSALGVTTDIAGTARPQFGGYDMGAYESLVEYVEYVPPYIFQMLFDTGDLSEATSVVDAGGDLVVSTDAAMGSMTNGLAVTVNDTTADYVIEDFTATTSGKLRIRFYFDPNSLTMAANNQFTMLAAYNGSLAGILLFDMIFSSGAYKLFTRPYSDAGSTVPGTAITITDAPHRIELYLQRASTDVASDGSMKMYIDGSLAHETTGLDNYDRFPSAARVSIGSVVGLDAETSGTYYLAKIEVNSTGTEIGA